MRIRTIGAAVIAWGLVAGCSTPRLYYETTIFQHAPLKAGAGQQAGLVRAVRSALGDRTLSVAREGGGWRQVHPGAAIEKVDGALLYAVAAVADDDYLGAEADIIIHGPGKRRTPVTVQVALDGSVYAFSGKAPPAIKRWPRKGKGGALGAALSRLTKAERRAIDGVEWHRGGRAPGTKGGHYYQTGCRAQIHIYNMAFAADGLQFTGAPTRPGQAALRSVLHEVGHAIHHAQTFEARCNYERARKKGDVRSANQWARRAEALDHSGGPVLQAFRKALAGREAPTPYGQESDEEAFAESFSLWKTDPAALERALPGLPAWFDSGAHVQALADGASDGLGEGRRDHVADLRPLIGPGAVEGEVVGEPL